MLPCSRVHLHSRFPQCVMKPASCISVMNPLVPGLSVTKCKYPFFAFLLFIDVFFLSLDLFFFLFFILHLFISVRFVGLFAFPETIFKTWNSVFIFLLIFLASFVS